jgi:DNA-binding NarL/FixJ family response regulator
MNSQDDRTSILIVDDHALLREGLREILQRQDDMRVVSEAADSATAVALAEREQPDIVLLDIEIPGGTATGTVSEIRRRSPGSDVIILSMYEGPQLVQALLTAGIRGYLLKSVHWQELVAAIRAVRTDRQRVVLWVSSESLGHVRQCPSASTLSEREREVLALVAEAFSNGQIASRLSLTEATVKRHLRNIFVKLGAVSRIDAVNKAAELGLLAVRAGLSRPAGQELRITRFCRRLPRRAARRSSSRSSSSSAVRKSSAKSGCIFGRRSGVELVFSSMV